MRVAPSGDTQSGQIWPDCFGSNGLPDIPECLCLETWRFHAHIRGLSTAFLAPNGCVIPERPNSLAIALIGPYSAGRKARPHRRQIQPGRDCLRVDGHGCLTVAASGPTKLVDTTKAWFSLRPHFARAVRALWNTHEKWKRAPQPKRQSTAHLGRLSISMAFAALFVLGMAVEHRAEIVNWRILRLALDGGAAGVLSLTHQHASVPVQKVLPAAPKSQPIAQPAVAAAKPQPNASSATRSSAVRTVPTSPVTRAEPSILAPTHQPITVGAPLSALPPLPSIETSLLSSSPRVFHKRLDEHRSRAETERRQDEDDQSGVNVTLRNAGHAHRAVGPNADGSASEDSAVNVTLGPEPAQQPSASAGSRPQPRESNGPSAQSAPFVAVTTNGGDLVTRDTATNIFKQIAPGGRLPNGQTLTSINQAHGTYTTNAGTFTYGE